jgi:tRNA threonylcarbamoyl adenosine modification protein (Sua5/YciO/YrdC/YwlC family)
VKANEPGSIALAAEAIKQGHLVVFPTDTLYGVGADAFNATAVARLYQVKQRPLEKGIPILLADQKDLAKVAREIPAIAAAYIDHFWPGPLTLIVPKSHLLPTIISPNEGVAVRIPAHDVARTLIKAAGGALAVSSANRSGQKPAQDAAQAWAALGGLVAAIVDDGPSPGDVASTIVDCTGDRPKILREGPIPARDLLTPALLRAGAKAS